MARTGMRVIDTAGRPITVDRDRLLSYGAGNFPWYFRQDPGPTNPLGRIKLMFPNRYNVYLHDTPARTLFDSEERTFSHGCVRLQDPVGLAVEVLNDRENWDRTDIQEAIDAGGETRTIPLSTPIEVLILYWTAATDESGEPRFHRDVYGRDDAVLRGLDADG
jgi:murein L,D-transpeptidase YcbB/YkuD